MSDDERPSRIPFKPIIKVSKKKLVDKQTGSAYRAYYEQEEDVEEEENIEEED